jgi:hypothetical protein
VSDRLETQTRLPFATTTYKADHDGVLRPELPSRCVFATGAQTCSIFVDHHRSRKTGPCFPLAVVGCSVHPVGRYTLYPPGHFPYGREAVAPYSPSGELLRDTATGQPLWEMTLFAAALDAAQGERWLEESPWDDSRRRRTQGCRLQASGRLTGVHPQLDDGVRERIATRLAVPTMKLFSGARMWTNDWKMRGEAIVAVLSVIPIQTSLLDRLLAAGAVSALWSSRHPQRWDADRETWVVAPLTGSECSEHPGLSARRGRSPPPTKSPDAAIGDGVIASES